MSRFMIGNCFLFLSLICAAVSQLLLKALLNEVRPERFDRETLTLFLTPDRIVRGGLAMTLVVCGFMFWLLSLVKLDLSYAYPVACSSVLLVAWLSGIFLGEAVTLRTWLATGVIVFGLVLLGPRT